MFSVTVICCRFLYTTALLALLASSAAAQQTEPDQLYGSGVDTKGNPTYFRVRLPSVTVVDIGPQGFPFPLGAAYDAVHNLYYWITLDAHDQGALSVSAGADRPAREVGPTGQVFPSVPFLTYSALDETLYGLATEANQPGLVYRINPGSGQGTLLGQVPAGYTQLSCDTVYELVYVSGPGQPLTLLDPSTGQTEPGAEQGAPTSLSTAIVADLQSNALWTLDLSGLAQGQAARLLGYGSVHWDYVYELTYSAPVTALDGADLARIAGLFWAPSETGDLYGYGSDSQGNATYFRFTLEAAAVEDIGADAFPFPLDAAYDPVHDVRYSIITAWDPQHATDMSTLWVTDGHTGRTTSWGTLSETIGPVSPSVAYQASTGLLYAVEWEPFNPTVLFQINPATLQVTVVPGPQPGGGIPWLCWNPVSGALYGSQTDEDFDTGAVMPLSIPGNQPDAPSITVGDFFLGDWFLAAPAFDASGRTFYAIGSESNLGEPRPAHLFIYDLDTGEPVSFAPALGVSYGPYSRVDDLFFATPR